MGLLSAVDELAGVHALSGDEQLLADLVAVGIAEVDDGEGSATAGIVDDVPDDALDVAITFGVVDGPELGSALPALGARREDRSGTLTLGSNNTTHFSTNVSFKRKKEKEVENENKVEQSFHRCLVNLPLRTTDVSFETVGLA